MESIDSIWQVGILALLAGIMIGLLGYRLFGRSTREGEKVQAELDAARDELASYRASVNQHFDKTSELVNDLTQNYVRVYQHLAEGATTLGDGRTFNNLIERHPGKVSLTVDGEARPSETDYDESAVEAAAPAEVPPETPAAGQESRAERPAAETAPAEPDSTEQSAAESTADEAAAASETAAEKADTDGETSAGISTDTREQKNAPPESAINVGALDDSAAAETAAADAVPEEDKKAETSRTVH